MADAMEPSVPKEWNFEPLLSDPARKVTVIDGDHDYADPGLSYWRRFAVEHPRIRLSVMPESGHEPWIDQPGLFADALRAAIDR